MEKFNIRLTVFTATYNRGHLIGRLYASLKRQKKANFEWLVIDDGSEDDTAEKFKLWQQEKNFFTIRYYKQENQGLNRTLNRGVQLACGEYFAKIDSDDYVVDEFAENIEKWTNEICGKEDIYAVGGVRITEEGKPIKGIWPDILPGQSVDASDLERAKYNLDADMCEAWKTDVLRKYPFPVWENEKFAPEQIVFHHIAYTGLKIRWYPIPMSICEYQENGLTKGARELEKNNPMGFAMMYNQKLEYLTGIRKKFFVAMQCNALCFLGKHIEYIKESKAPFYSFITLLPGAILSIRRRWQYKKML